MARITVLGGTGYAGAHVIEEARRRGHEVTSFSRSTPEPGVEGVDYQVGSLTDDAVLSAAANGADAVVAVLSPRADMAGKLRPTYAALADKLADTETYLVVLGGAGTLQVAPGGPRLVDGPDFPAEFKAEALELGDVLADLQTGSGELAWTFVSPAAGFGAFAPGERLGAYRTGEDVLLVDEDGESFISGPDLATALVDEVESKAHQGRRFTVAY